QMAQDIPGTLAAVAKLGYQGIELENAFGKTGQEWHGWLQTTGLRACGFNQAIGNKNLIIRSLPRETYESAELLAKTAETVNAISEQLKPHGMRVGYHNHTLDFKKIGNEYWWNLFADQTKKNVILQFDTGNASEMSGVSVTDFLKRNKGRTVSM